MGLLDNYSGIGMSPRPRWQHQIAMSNFHANAANELKRKGLLFLSEATITDDWDDNAPDLVIFNKAMMPLSIIEITRSYQLGPILEKCEELMERFPMSEYFVYDYEQEILYQYDATTDQWLSSEDYVLRSQYLTKPIMQYIME